MHSLLRLTVICVACGLTFANEDWVLIDSIRPEPPCSSEGGMCTKAADCPKGQLAKQPGLCPEQQNREVECCFGISKKETRCHKRGGECMAECGGAVKIQDVTDCPKSYTCCLLLY